MKTVNKPFRKKDAMQLVTGQPVYMDDIIPQDCLIVKLLRSPHANAIVRSINTAVAKKVPGIEAIFTWEDVPQDARRYTQAGQTYPEASPYDRLLIDRHVRFVGDVVAIVAGKDEKCVDKALKLIKVDYEVLEAVLDFHTARITPSLCTRRTTGKALPPWVPTTSATSALMMNAATVISTLCWPGVMWSSTMCTTLRPASRP